MMELIDLHKQTTKDVTKWSNFQMVRKICLNSLYGWVTITSVITSWRTEAVTSTGQVTIRWIKRSLNEFVNKALGTEGHDYVIASDTDSIYLHLGPLVTRVFGDDAHAQRVVPVLNEFCENKVEPFIQKCYKELSDYLNCYEETLVMKRECMRKGSGLPRSDTSSTCGTTRVSVTTNPNSRWWASRLWSHRPLHLVVLTLNRHSRSSWRAQNKNSLSSLRRRDWSSHLSHLNRLGPSFYLPTSPNTKSPNHLREGDTTPHSWVCDVQPLLTWEETNSQV